MATKSGLPESTIRKLVRYAVAQRIFEEPQPGVIAHSAASRLLAEDPGVHDFVATCSDELWQAAAQTCNALVKFPGSEEPNETVCATTSVFLPSLPLSRHLLAMNIDVNDSRASPWQTIPTSPCMNSCRIIQIGQRDLPI